MYHCSILIINNKGVKTCHRSICPCGKNFPHIFQGIYVEEHLPPTTPVKLFAKSLTGINYGQLIMITLLYSCLCVQLWGEP